MIEFASDKYISQIKTLWCRTFGDSEEAIQKYFSLCHKNENMLLDTENGTLCAMLTMFPLTLFYGKAEFDGRYIYAVATDTAHRMQGRSTRLLKYAHEYMKKQGVAASVLVPASASLFDFYEKRGYKKTFRLKKTLYGADLLEEYKPKCIVSPCTAEEYWQIRKAAFADSTPFAAWDSDMLRRVMGFAAYYGGEFYRICTCSGEAAAFCVRDKDEVAVKELAAVNMPQNQAAAALHTLYGAQRYTIYSSLEKSEDGFNYAMLYALDDSLPEAESPYFNLAMD